RARFEAQIARSDAALETRHYDAAEAAAREALSASEGPQATLLHPDALHQLASVQMSRGHFERAGENFEQAVWEGMAVGRDGRVANSLTMLLGLTGDELNDDDGWKVWDSALRATLARIPGDGVDRDHRQLQYHNAL